MHATKQLIQMVKFCSSNNSMKEILLTAIHYYNTEHKDFSHVYIKELQGYVDMLNDQNRKDTHNNNYLYIKHHAKEIIQNILWELEMNQ